MSSADNRQNKKTKNEKATAKKDTVNTLFFLKKKRLYSSHASKQSVLKLISIQWAVMLAFRCADSGLIALRSTSQNVHLDEGKIIMALASTAALMLMKKKGWLFRYSNQMEELGGALSAVSFFQTDVEVAFVFVVLSRFVHKILILTTCEVGVECKASIVCL